jgi:DNA-binding LacI/PurR family transcriptional regulator
VQRVIAETPVQDQALILLPPAIVQTGLRGLAVDGGIVVDPSPLDPRVTLLAGQGLPVVTIERDLGRPDDPWYVASETDANTRRVLDHLAARGARRIALLMPQTDWGWAAETLEAYDAWTREHGAPRLVVPVVMQSGEENAFRATRQLLIAGGVDSVHAREGEPPVTALDLHPDRQAEMAVEMLLARLDEGEVEVEAPRHIPATLRVRASTGGP